MNPTNTRIIKRGNNDTLLLKYEIKFNSSLINPTSFVNISSYQAVLNMFAEENILVNSYKQDFIFNSMRDTSIIKVLAIDGIIYVSLPLIGFKNHSYICSLNIVNKNINLELNRFQLILDDNYG